MGLLLTFNLQAQTVTIHVETAGTLPTLIAEGTKYQITDLTLTGDLNGTDIRYINEMTGHAANEGAATNGKLAILDLSGANIVSGGYPYSSYPEIYTVDNTIGKWMFSGNTLTSCYYPK
ncbi:hypothetical protein FACS1894162_5150 [Bacteroidia bacterium]|nr:hypothetical protein FACS1894162_5150 [Bacteroidia bacterium]